MAVIFEWSNASAQKSVRVNNEQHARLEYHVWLGLAWLDAYFIS